MESAEASGKTVDDALNRALAKLGASREDVEFTILDEGQKGGLFGRGAREAVVRVDILPGAAPRNPAPSPEPAPAPAPRARRAPAASAAPAMSEAGPPAEAPAPRGEPRGDGQRRGPRPPAARDGARSGGGGSRGGPRGGGGGGRRGFETPVPRLTDADFTRPPVYDDDAPAEDRGPAPEQQRSAPAPRAAAPSRDRGGDRGERGGGGDRPERGGERDRGERRRREDLPEVAPDINAEEVDFAAQVVDDLLRILDIDADITIREPLTPGDGLGAVLAVIDIKGRDLGLLIGRRGDTLIAMQYLVNLVVTRRYPGKGGVSLDVEHYKHRREEQLVSLAQRMADRVRQTGSAITLEPMSAAERRLIHMALAEDPELVTNSIGEGENRKVVISTR